MPTTVRTAVRTYLLFGRSPEYFQHLCEKNGFVPASERSSLMRRKRNRYEDYVAYHITQRSDYHAYIHGLPIEDRLRVKAVLLTPAHDYDHADKIDDFSNVYRESKEYNPDFDPYFDDFSWWTLYAGVRAAQKWEDYDYDDIFFG